MQVGTFEILPVVDGAFAFPANLFYPDVTQEDWLPHKRFLRPDGMIEMPFGGFLIRGPDRLALVDVGLGPVEAAPDLGGKLLESLSTLGHTPDEVTDVVFSHLHFDHIGWASRDGQIQFPNATYRCNRKDWDYFIIDRTHQGPFTESLGISPFAEAWLEPVSERIELWDGDVGLLPGIDVRDAPGHTPGSSVVVVSSGADRALLLGDAVHCPAELLESEWELLGDADPALARRTREALAKEYEGTDVMLAAPHFPEMQFGRLLPAEGKRNWVVP